MPGTNYFCAVPACLTKFCLDWLPFGDYSPTLVGFLFWHICLNLWMEVLAVNTILLKLYFKFQELTSREEGQDLVEYALVVALIAFGATAGMKALATGLDSAFGNISTKMGSYVS
jgi:pilus assembly protein Flp/PilA